MWTFGGAAAASSEGELDVLLSADSAPSVADAAFSSSAMCLLAPSSLHFFWLRRRAWSVKSMPMEAPTKQATVACGSALTLLAAAAAESRRIIPMASDGGRRCESERARPVGCARIFCQSERGIPERRFDELLITI